MKTKQVFVCTECGAEHPKWMGKCTNCGAWSSLEEKQVVSAELKAAKRLIQGNTEVQNLGDVDVTQQNKIPTTFSELDQVLNGGISDDQVILLAGQPGIGKSTLLLQLLVNLSQPQTGDNLKVLYISGEESVGQITARAARIYPQKQYTSVQFLLSTSVSALISKVSGGGKEMPDLVVVDSIQTMFDDAVTGLPGSLSQVKACTSALVTAAKQFGFRLIIVGHINKDGDIAGPKVLEHLVDTVLLFEGERGSDVRVLRVLKNRFGSTGEVGVMQMTDLGVQDADLASGVFAGGDEDVIGAAKTLVVEGNRPIIVQVQALTNKTVFAYPKRVAEGISVSRLQLICAILDRFADTRLGDQDVYVRTAGGYSLDTPASDLAVAAAILSSVGSKQINGDSLYVGELGLSGKVGLPASLVEKLGTLSKFGISNVLSPLFPAKAAKASPKFTIVSGVGQLAKLI